MHLTHRYFTAVTTAAVCVALCAAVPAAHAQQAVISNGTISLGVNAGGALGALGVGLLNATGNDALFPSSSGWGAAVASGLFAGLNDGQNMSFFPAGPVGATSFTSTANSATSNVDIGCPDVCVAPVMSVMQAYHPSGVAGLFEDDVTITNTSGVMLGDPTDPTAIRYRFEMGWFVNPTPFNVFSTIVGNGATNLIGTDDELEANSDPLTLRQTSGCDPTISTDTDFYHSGPCLHGALFDFGFPSLAAGASRTFEIFLGAADNEPDALQELADVGSDNVYALGQADCSTTLPAGNIGDDPCVAANETFVVGFKGVGGVTATPEPSSLVLMATGFVAMIVAVRRRTRA